MRRSFRRLFDDEKIIRDKPVFLQYLELDF